MVLRELELISPYSELELLQTISAEDVSHLQVMHMLMHGLRQQTPSKGRPVKVSILNTMHETINEHMHLPQGSPYASGL